MTRSDTTPVVHSCPTCRPTLSHGARVTVRRRPCCHGRPALSEQASRFICRRRSVQEAAHSTGVGPAGASERRISACGRRSCSASGKMRCRRTQPWSIGQLSYQDLEPYYDRVEWELGVSGQAGNIGGELVPGGNPFEAPRRRGYPMPPLHSTAGTRRFVEATQRLGYHPFPQAAAIASVEYKTLKPCVYCGFCHGYPCHVGAKQSTHVTSIPGALATGNLKILPFSRVFRVNRESRSGACNWGLVRRRWGACPRANGRCGCPRLFRTGEHPLGAPIRDQWQR